MARTAEMHRQWIAAPELMPDVEMAMIANANATVIARRVHLQNSAERADSSMCWTTRSDD